MESNRSRESSPENLRDDSDAASVPSSGIVSRPTMENLTLPGPCCAQKRDRKFEMDIEELVNLDAFPMQRIREPLHDTLPSLLTDRLPASSVPASFNILRDTITGSDPSIPDAGAGKKDEGKGEQGEEPPSAPLTAAFQPAKATRSLAQCITSGLSKVFNFGSSSSSKSAPQNSEARRPRTAPARPRFGVVHLADDPETSESGLSRREHAGGPASGRRGRRGRRRDEQYFWCRHFAEGACQCHGEVHILSGIDYCEFCWGGRCPGPVPQGSYMYRVLTQGPSALDPPTEPKK